MRIPAVRFGDLGLVYVRDEKKQSAKAFLEKLKCDYTTNNPNGFYLVENWEKAAGKGQTARFLYATGEQRPWHDSTQGFPDLAKAYDGFAQTKGATTLKELTPHGLTSLPDGSTHVEHRTRFEWWRGSRMENGLLRTHWIV